MTDSAYLSVDLFDSICRDANNPLDMKPLPKEPDDERRKKSKVAKGTYSMLIFIVSLKVYFLYKLYITWY